MAVRRNFDCGACGRPAVVKGLCSRDYKRLRKYGTTDIDPHRAPQVPGEVVIEEWEFLRRCGVSRDEAARRLGMTRTGFDKALQRARKRVAE